MQSFKHLLIGVSWALAASVALGTACSSSDERFGGGTASGGGGFDVGDPNQPPGSEPGPEEELEEHFEAPAAVGRFLWAANPLSHRVALVDATSLDVQSFDAGFGPTHLAGIAPQENRGSGAIVLNVLSQNATLFRLPAEPEPPISAADVSVHTLPVHRHANAWRVGPRSRYAIAWSNAALMDGPDPADGFQDITVIDLESSEPKAVRLSVGYRPSQVFVNEEEDRAYVVSQPGITVLHIDGAEGPRIEHELFLPEHVDATSRDVSFTPDGSLAFVRLSGESDVLVVNTRTDARVTVQLPAPVTDLDVSLDGSRAVAVMRRTVLETDPEGTAGAAGSAGAPSTGEASPSRVAVLDVATITTDPTDYTLLEFDELFGSAVLSADGQYALLFTNAVAHPMLVVVDLEAGTHRTLDLKAPVRAAFVTPDSSHAVVLLSQPPGSAHQGAFSLVPLRQQLPARVQGTNAPARFVSLSADPSRALITTRGSGQQPHEVYLARFPDLRVDSKALQSLPLSSGILEDAGKGFVAQSHPEGRVTFVGLEDGATQTLTGFELGGRVVQ